MNETLYVVAKDYSSYLHWCQQKGYSPHGRGTGPSVKYVRGVESLRGLYNVRILCIEGWTDRPDWRELHTRILFAQRRPGGQS